MPAIPTSLALEVPDLPRVAHYLGNAAHRNHRGYIVQKPVGHGVADGPAFVKAIGYAMDCINGPRVGKETVQVAARWYVLSFSKGSHLTDEEWASCGRMAILALGVERPYLLSRHKHRSNGEGDLNIIDPEIRLDPIPHLDRPRSIFRLLRLRHASDRWTEQANQARLAIDKAPIPMIDPIADSAATGLAKLVRLLAEHLPGTNSFGRDQVRGTLTAAGFKAEDWAMSITGKLSIYRWPGEPERKSKPRPFKVAVKELVTWLWLHLSRRNLRNSPRKKTMKTELPVSHGLRTAPEVIRPPGEPSI